jgi:hypothetical protein
VRKEGGRLASIDPKKQPEKKIQVLPLISVGAIAEEWTERHLQIAILHRYNETTREVFLPMADLSGDCNGSLVAQAVLEAYHSRAQVE